MDISALKRNVSAANLPLEKLAGSKQVSEQEKIAEASRQFEAVLLRQILSQAQKRVAKGATSAVGGSGQAIYQDLATQQLADRISHGGSFGFAKVLEKQLAAQYIKKTDAPTTLKPLNADINMRSQLKPLNTDNSMKTRLHSGSANSVNSLRPAANPIKSTHVRGQPGKRFL